MPVSVRLDEVLDEGGPTLYAQLREYVGIVKSGPNVRAARALSV